ncbi:acidic mammalian chitinase-like isoform X2 [Uranotaenia lowii]|uniref:acidic mammalian chitinase-like isoform X2 n=1 Tax=Uranotaenia lowii TaxID=190385 RepID=UPI00247A98AB|nr:acidic mammalian chitinase-like isoform X2 [Uranotaenia lowii]
MRVFFLQRLLLLFGICGISIIEAAPDKVVCYYGTWANYRAGNGRFSPEDVNPNLCTHMIYTFVGLNRSTYELMLLDKWFDVDLKGLEKFANFKLVNPNLKRLVAIGGYNEGSSQYSTMANSAVTRTAFINSVVSFVKQYGLDGFDIDWEYPTLRGGQIYDRENFVTLLQEMRARFDREGLILSIAVAATPDYHLSAYNVPEINKYVDFVNLMSYDLHAYWDGSTGHNAPLYAATWETSYYSKMLNVAACVQGWLDDGLDPKKLILGVPVFGHTFTLASTTSNGVAARSTGGGQAGAYTLESGTLSYLEICEKFKKGGFTKVWDDVQKVPYAYSGNQWISYDDETSLLLKINYAKSKNLGGLMVWSIESDDAKNICGNGANPIGTFVYKNVIGTPGTGTTTTQKPATTTTQATTTTTKATTTTTKATTTTTKATTTTTKPTTTTTKATITTTKASVTTTAIPATLTCPPSGFLRDPNDCRAFYQCYPGFPVYTSWRFLCPSNLAFDSTTNTCNYTFLVNC